jgi:hypothetical protein
VLVTSTGASGSLFDVTVRASVNGLSTNHTLTVYSPHRLVAGPISTTCPFPTWGYRTTLRYGIRDQFGSALPNGAALNERWTTGVVNHWSGTNWGRDTVGAGGNITGSTFDDQIDGERVGKIPSTSCASSTLVQSWGQAWYIGSVTSGVGKRVQTNTLVKRRGSATHTNIVTPAP